MRKTLFTLMLSTCGAAQANDIYLDINPDTAHGRFDAVHSTRNLHLSAAAMITNDNGSLLSLGAWTHSDFSPNHNLRGGLGGKLYAVDPNGDDFFALAPGGRLIFDIAPVAGLSVATEVFYAPSMLISEDLDSFVDFSVRVSYELFENAAVYAGARTLHAKRDGFDSDMDEGLHAGIKLSL